MYYTKISPDGTLSVLDNAPLVSSLSIVPNPVRSTTTVAFEAFGSTQVRVYDILGREVAQLMDVTVNGPQQITWNRTNEQGQQVASGIYFVSVDSNGKKASQKLVVE